MIYCYGNDEGKRAKSVIKTTMSKPARYFWTNCTVRFLFWMGTRLVTGDLTQLRSIPNPIIVRLPRKVVHRSETDCVKSPNCIKLYDAFNLYIDFNYPI